MYLTDPASPGWQYVNSLMGEELERYYATAATLESESDIDDVYENDVSEMYVQEFLPPIPVDLRTLSGFISGSIVDIQVVDNASDWLWQQPTRLTYDRHYRLNQFLDHPAQAIGVEYVRNHPSGNVWIINQDVDPSGNRCTLIFNDDLSKVYSTTSYGKGTVNFANILKDTYLFYAATSGTTFGSGYLDNVPLSSTVKVFDIFNLDASGNATEVTSNWTWDGAHVLNWASASSTYIVEYEHRTADLVKCITTPTYYQHRHTWSSPMFTRKWHAEASGYLALSLADSPAPASGKLFIADAWEVRPGLVASFRLNYSNITGLIMPVTSGQGSNNQYTFRVQDVDYHGTSSGGIVITDPSGYYTIGSTFPLNSFINFPIDVSGSWVTIHYPSGIKRPTWPNGDYGYRVTVRYNAQRVWGGVVATESFNYASGSTDPYPWDWDLIDNRIYPRSIFRVVDHTGYGGFIESSNISDWTAFTPVDFTGVAVSDFDYFVGDNIKKRRAVWKVDRMNQRINVYDVDGGYQEYHDLFLPNMAISGMKLFVEPSSNIPYKPWKRLPGDVTMYAWQPTTMNVDGRYRDLRGLTYYAGKLYVLGSDKVLYNPTPYTANVYPSADIPTLYQIDPFNTNVWKAWTLERVVNPMDITVTEEEAFGICDTSGVHIFKPNYDYATIDYQNGIIYYREKYEYVFASGLIPYPSGDESVDFPAHPYGAV